MEEELEECNEILEDIKGSPWGNGSPGNELLSSEIPSPSCNNVTEETDENIERFCELALLIIVPSLGSE